MILWPHFLGLIAIALMEIVRGFMDFDFERCRVQVRTDGVTSIVKKTVGSGNGVEILLEVHRPNNSAAWVTRNDAEATCAKWLNGTRLLIYYAYD